MVAGLVTTVPVMRQYSGAILDAGTSTAPVGAGGREAFRSLIGPIVIPDGAAACASAAVHDGEARPGVAQRTRVLRTTATHSVDSKPVLGRLLPIVIDPPLV
jgi:hypothetical protein